MANYKCYYLGPYIKVYPPKVTYTDNIYTCNSHDCKEHGKHLSGNNFCNLCGSPVAMSPVLRNSRVNMTDFLEEEFNDCDMFCVIHLDDKDYQLLIGNREEQGGIHINDFGEYSLPENTNFFEHTDWARTIAKLKEIGYKFEIKVGLVAYYN